MRLVMMGISLAIGFGFVQVQCATAFEAFKREGDRAIRGSPYELVDARSPETEGRSRGGRKADPNPVSSAVSLGTLEREEGRGWGEASVKYTR